MITTQHDGRFVSWSMGFTTTTSATSYKCALCALLSVAAASVLEPSNPCCTTKRGIRIFWLQWGKLHLLFAKQAAAARNWYCVFSGCRSVSKHWINTSQARWGQLNDWDYRWIKSGITFNLPNRAPPHRIETDTHINQILGDRGVFSGFEPLDYEIEHSLHHQYVE